MLPSGTPTQLIEIDGPENQQNCYPIFPENPVTFTYQFQPVRNLCILTMILLLAACTKETEEESFMRYTFKGKEIRHTGSFQSFQATGNSGVYVQKSHSPLPPDVYLIEGISGMYNRITVVLATHQAEIHSVRQWVYR
jgi:hypothetical protein